jgi:hypothetical protein
MDTVSPLLVHCNESLLYSVLNLSSYNGNVLPITVSFITMSINTAPKFLDMTFKNHSRVSPKHSILTHNYFLKICLPPVTKALKMCHQRNEVHECSRNPKLKSSVFHTLSETINRRTASYYKG